jgi:hypothetical protein
MSKESGRKSPWKCQSQAEISGKLIPTWSSIEANMLHQTLTYVGLALAMLIGNGIVWTGPHRCHPITSSSLPTH